MNVTTMGIDLAKYNFSLVGMNKHSKVELRKSLPRTNLLSFIVNYPPCLIGMEASSGDHYWSREFHKLGDSVDIIAA